MKCKKDEIELTDVEGEGVCIADEKLREAGKEYGGYHSSFDPRYGIEDSKGFIREVFTKRIKGQDQPNWNFYEALDDWWQELPPAYYELEVMCEEFASENKLDKEELSDNEDARDLFREGFGEGYDMFKDVVDALKQSREDMKILLPLKHVGGDSGILVEVESDDYVQTIIESTAGASTKKEFLQKFGEKILDEGEISTAYKDIEEECYRITPVDREMKDYLKTVVDGTKVDEVTEEFEEC